MRLFNLNLFHKRQKNLEPDINLPGEPVKNNRRVVVTLIAALVAVAGLAFYFWNEARTLSASLTLDKETRITENEVESVITKVGALMVLPSDEVPTVATVSDPDKIKSQPFFSGAKIGDKVLIYSKSQKAILYDPVANKIVNVAPINL